MVVQIDLEMISLSPQSVWSESSVGIHFLCFLCFNVKIDFEYNNVAAIILFFVDLF